MVYIYCFEHLVRGLYFYVTLYCNCSSVFIQRITDTSSACVYYFSQSQIIRTTCHCLHLDHSLSEFTIVQYLSTITAVHYGDHQARCTNYSCESCSGTLAPLHLVSVEFIVCSAQNSYCRFSTVSKTPKGSDEPETSCGPTEKIEWP